MSYFDSNVRSGMRKVAYTYNITTAASTTPITISDIKSYLKLDDSDDTEDCYLGILLEAAVAFGEKYTGRDFINKTYTTFRDNFNCAIELRRSKVSSITSISYLSSGSFTAISSSVYGFTDVNDYPIVFLNDGQAWPTGFDNVPQAIKIIFVSGYGANGSSVPAALKIAMLSHIAAMYENRGDCDDGGKLLPANAKTIYNQYRIINIGSSEKPMEYFRGY